MGMAMALPDDGVLVACDLSSDHMAVAQSWWDRAGVSERIEPRIGPAIESLEAMLADGQGGTYDFMYFDADTLALVANQDSDTVVALTPGQEEAVVVGECPTPVCVVIV